MSKQFFILLSLLIVLMVYRPSLAHISHSHSDEQNQKHLILEMKVHDFDQTLKTLQNGNADVTYANKKLGVIHVAGDLADFQLYSQDKMSSVKVLKSLLVFKPDSKYKDPGEIDAWVSDLAKKYPNLVHVESIGKTLEGRDQWGIRISDDDEINKDEPAILFNGLHHAREVMTVEVIQDIVDQLVKDSEKDSLIKSWIIKYQVWIVPMVNPDGSNRVWTTDTMWRKNVRGGYGVDINRNYPYKWGACNGSSGSTGSQTYRGESAGSEPETQNMMKLVLKANPSFDISFHSYGEMVIYPFGCNGIKPPAESRVEAMGKEMAGLINYNPGAAWEILYDVDGGDIDWMYGVAGVIPYVIELSKSSEGFQPSYSTRDALVTKIRLAWKYLFTQLDQGTGLLVGTDSEIGLDKATIDIEKRSLMGWKKIRNLPINNQVKFVPLLKGQYRIIHRVNGLNEEIKKVNISGGEQLKIRF